MSDAFAWIDGELVEWDKAQVHVGSNGLHYGIGFFEGVRCYSTDAEPTFFRLRDHLLRLASSAAIYGLTLPRTLDELSGAAKATVRANGLSDCYVRPIAFLGEAASPFKATLRMAILATPESPVESGMTPTARAKISSFQRMAIQSIPPAAKACGQYLSSYLAQSEALAGGYDQALCMNHLGFVADGWAHNIFIVRAGELITPPVATGVLAGITRDSIITLAREAGMTVVEKDITRTDVYLAEECFLTGTAAGVVPLRSVDDRPIGAAAPGPVTSLLLSRFTEIVHGRTADHCEWREPVTG